MAEEINRQITDRLSNLCYCPTKTSLENLQAEGLSKQAVLVGDVMYDSALFFAKKASKSNIIDRLGLNGEGFVLSTVHRAENVDNRDRMLEILLGLSRIGKSQLVVLPVHPRAKSIIEEVIHKEVLDNILLVSPVSYLDFTKLILCAEGVITDSGGVQKEAYFHKKPCITLREETEWVETVQLGSNILAGADREKIFDSWSNWKFIEVGASPYGKGDSASKILDSILNSNICY